LFPGQRHHAVDDRSQGEQAGHRGTSAGPGRERQRQSQGRPTLTKQQTVVYTVW